MTIRAALLIAAALAAAPVRGQVIEIGQDGSATTYDRPMLFTAAAATPVDPPAPAVTRDALADTARAHGVEPRLMAAVAWAESRGRQDVVSRRGALGVMQLMPATAAELGVDPRDPADNLRGGAIYLRRQLDRFGSVPLALAAYNAGPGAVLRHGGIPPFAETRDYVAGILRRLPALPQALAAPMMFEVPAP